MKKRPVINMSVLPGQPLNGTGKMCIHLFVQDEKGSFVEPHALHPALDENGAIIKQQLVAKETRGRLACDAKKQVAPTTRNGVTTITHRSDDPRVVTCPRCKQSVDYTQMMQQYEEVV